MGVVEDAGVEASLPELSGAAFEGVAISGVAAVNVHHEERDGIGLIAHRNQVEVTARCSLWVSSSCRQYWRSASLAKVRCWLLPRWARWSQYPGGAKRAFRGKFEPPLISVFGRGKFS